MKNLRFHSIYNLHFQTKEDFDKPIILASHLFTCHNIGSKYYKIFELASVSCQRDQNSIKNSENKGRDLF